MVDKTKFTSQTPWTIGRGTTQEFSRGDSAKFIKHILRQVNLKAIIRPELTAIESGDYDTFTPKAHSAMRRRIENMAKSQQRVYESYLDGLSKLLDEGVKDQHYMSVDLKTAKGAKTIATASPGWKPLSKETKRIKAADPNLSNNFWRHTGKLARAFKAAVKKQKTGLHTGNFIQVNDAVRQLEGSVISFNEEKANLEFNFTLGVLVPKWKGKEGQLMDTLITDPYAGVKNRTMLSNAVSKVQQKREQSQKLLKMTEDKIQQDITALNKNRSLKGTPRKELRHELVSKLIEVQKKQELTKYQYHKESMDKLTQNYAGLRRFILPEHNRPFIRKLSRYAGLAARADLKNMA